ncbi:hypothetical protein PSN45_004427 [Yamadazyma tenuis]|nr:hypothetical protein PSN45_004427 [Yamadazyma tenuis]
MSSRISESLNDSVDDYNRFIKVLSFKPSDIPVSLYLHFLYEHKFSLDERTRNLFVSRLAFHNLYEHIWKVFIDESSTINDIEELAIIIGETAKENNNIDIGLLKALIEAQGNIPNQSLKAVLLDCISHNFDISRNTLSEALITYDQHPSLSKPLSVMNIYEVILILRQKLHAHEDVNAEVKTLHDLCISKKGNIAGWFAFITENIESKSLDKELLELILQMMKGAGLNDYDISRIIDLNIMSSSSIYELFQQEYVYSNISWSLNRLTNKLIDRDVDSLLSRIVLEHHNELSNDILVSCLQEMFKKEHESFLKCLRSMLDAQNHRKYEQVYKHFFETYRPNGIESILLHKAMLKTNNSHDFYLRLRVHLPIAENERRETIELYRDFITAEIRPTTVLLELIRSMMVRNRVLDANVIDELVKTSILKLTKVTPMGIQVIDEKKKIKLNNTVRAIAQSLSILETQEGMIVLNNLYQCFVNSKEFSNMDLRLRLKIYKTLLLEVFRFISRDASRNIDIGLLAKDLIIDDKIRSYICYFYEVKNCPTKSLQIVKEFADDKSKFTKNIMDGVEAGILSSKLEVDEKLELYKSFRKELSLYGFKAKIKPKNIVSLMQLVLKSQSGVLKEGSLDRILSFSLKQGVPYHVINKLVKQKRTR